MTTKLLLALLPLLAAAGCTRKTLYAPDPEAFEVRFQTSGLSIEASDTPNRTKGSLPGGTLNITVYQGSEFILQKSYNVGSEGVIAPADGKELTLEAGTYDFYAYGPNGTLNTTQRTTTITHGTDFIAAKVLGQSITAGETDIELTFTHLASKVSFEIKGSAELSVTTLNVTKVTLSQISTSPATYTLGSALTPSRGTASANTYIIDEFEQAADKKSAAGWGIVLPKSAGTFGLEAQVTVNGKAITLTATVPSMTFEAGKHYAFSAEVKAGDIQLKLTVTNWTNVGYTEDGVGA